MATPKNTTKDKAAKTPEKAVTDKTVVDKAVQDKPAADTSVQDKTAETKTVEEKGDATKPHMATVDSPKDVTAETASKGTTETAETEPKQSASTTPDVNDAKPGETAKTAKAEPETKKAPQQPETGKGETTVIVLCSLPQGISFALPNGETFTLKGKNAGLVYHGAGVNRLPKDIWQTIKTRYGSMQAFQNKAIVEETSEQRAKSLAQELIGVKTGFEAVDPEKPGKDLTKATGQG